MSKVVLLIANKILPVDELEVALEELGYSCITLDTYIRDIEFPVFDIAIVGLENRAQYLHYNNELQQSYNNPIIFYNGHTYREALEQYEQLEQAYFLSAGFSTRELTLTIELATLQKRIDRAALFYNDNPDSNHARLKKILTEDQAWRILFEQSPNGVLLGDENGHIIYTNKAASVILGYSAEEFLKLRFHDLVDESYRDTVDKNIARILNGETLITEVYNKHKDGSLRYVQLHETRVIFPNGKYGIMVLSTDITRAKKAEEESIETLKRYRDLIEHSLDGIIYSKNDKIIYGNQSVLNLVGRPEEEVIGSAFTKFIHPDEREKILNRHKRRLQGYDEPTIYETSIVNSKGERVYVELNVALVEMEHDKVTMVFIRDITNRKLAEKAIRESEESYRGLLDNASEGIFILDKNGVIIDVNLAGQQLLGSTKEHLVGTKITNYAHSGFDIEQFTHKANQAYGGKSQSLEFIAKRPDGGELPMDLYLSQGTYFGLKVVMGMGHDITERKKTEQFLKESEDKYRNLTERLPVGIYRLSPEGEITYCNPAFAHTVGYKNPNSLIGKNIADFIRTDFNEWVNNPLSENTLRELSIYKRNGKKIWVNNRITPISNNKGTVRFYDGVIFDITDRKMAIDELKMSEKKFRAMIMTIPDRLFRVNRDATLIDYAPTEIQFFPKFNYSMLGKPLNEFVCPDFFDKLSFNIKQAAKTKELQTFEFISTIDNEDYYYEIRVLPTDDDIFLILQRDITRQKLYQNRLRMLAQAIMNVNDSVSITDLNGHFVLVNPAFTRIYGYTQEEIIGKSTATLRPPDIDPELAKEIHEKTLAGGWQGELINVRKDGSRFPIHLSTAVVQNEKNQPVVLVGIASDITNRKKMEQELIKAKEKAEESDRLKTAFLSNMSHEIRSPMNAVLGFIQLLRNEEHLSEAGRQYIDLIQNSGNQLLSLIDDIIDISRIQSNQIKINKVDFDLNQLLEELYQIYTNQLSLSESETILKRPFTPKQSPFPIHSDPIRIRQILSNLLSNAVKFTPKGIITFGYTLEKSAGHDYILFYVKDTGIGISPKAQKLIFGQFRQADDSYTRQYGGSGLGLAICKGLAELLNGEITLKSKEGQGSEFFFKLPLTPSDK